MDTNIEQYCTDKMPRQKKVTLTFPFAVQQNGTHSVEVVSSAKNILVLNADAFNHLRANLGEKLALEIEARMDEEFNRLYIIHSMIISRA